MADREKTKETGAVSSATAPQFGKWSQEDSDEGSVGSIGKDESEPPTAAGKPELTDGRPQVAAAETETDKVVVVEAAALKAELHKRLQKEKTSLSRKEAKRDSPRKRRDSHHRRDKSASHKKRHRSRSPSKTEEKPTHKSKSPSAERPKRSADHSPPRHESHAAHSEWRHGGGRRHYGGADRPSGERRPAYLNKRVIRQAEVVQRRKLLWRHKPDEAGPSASTTSESGNQWQAALAGCNADERSVAKFQKLMGMKGAAAAAPTEAVSADAAETERRRQQSLFHDLDRQYHMARTSTHTQRGIGLGFGLFTQHQPPSGAP